MNNEYKWQQCNDNKYEMSWKWKPQWPSMSSNGNIQCEILKAMYYI